MARASDRWAPELALDRRGFLRAAAALLVAAAAPPPLAARAARSLPEATRRLLEESPFVYVSPLRSDGSESTCHGEVWFAWLDGAVVLVTAQTSWKARSVERGLGGARIWVGDHGPWKRVVGASEAFREAPRFDAAAARSKDPALFEHLLARYREKYPAEIARWEPRFRSGFASGERVLLRYEPL
jgi:hypothetical protein